MSATADADPLLRRVLLVALAVISFGAVAWGLRQLVPWPEEYGLHAKYEYFREHKDEFDAVYVGSSRVFRSFDPLVIDPAVEAEGIPFRSFNLGVGGMVSFEMDFLLREIAALRPARLKWIFSEGGPWEPDVYFLDNTWSSRSIFWHDTTGMRTVWTSTLVSDRPWFNADGRTGKIELLWTHLRLCGMKLANMAQGERIVKHLAGLDTGPNRRALSSAELERNRGYESLDKFLVDEARELGKEPIYEFGDVPVSTEVIAGQNSEALDVEHYDFAALRAQYAVARSIGARLVIVIPPQHVGAPDRLRLHERGDIPDLVNFNDPARHPQLFRIENRFDYRHLNAAGAADFSRLFAAEAVRLLKTSP
jgi:hypothetical protein